MAHDHEIIEPQNPAAEAREYARYFLKNGHLPEILDWKIANAFKYAWGPVGLNITRALDLGVSASWGEVYRAINHRIDPPKTQKLEPIIVDCRRPELTKPPRVAKEKVPAPDVLEAETDAAPAANDWRAAIRGE